MKQPDVVISISFPNARGGVVESPHAIQLSLDQLHGKVNKLMTTMDDVRAAVKRNNDAGDSFRTYIKGVIDQLKQANQTPAGPTQAELQAIIDDLDRGTEADVAAMTENTPVDPNAQSQPTPSNP
jgi:maltose-binding protein MalE